MRRISSRVSVALVTVMVALAAQSRAQDYTQWAFTGAAQSPVTLGLLQPQGQVRRLLPGGILGSLTGLSRAEMDVDNRSVVAMYLTQATGGGLIRLGSGGTVTRYPIPGVPLFGPRPVDFTVSGDGDYDVLTAGGISQGTGIFTMDSFGQLTTVVQTTLWGSPVSFTRDPDNGDYVILTRPGQIFAPPVLMRYSPGGVVNTFAQIPTFTASMSDVTLDGSTGDVLLVVGSDVLRVTASGTITTMASSVTVASFAPLTNDRESSLRPRCLVATQGPSVIAIDLQNGATTQIAASPDLAFMGGLFPLRGRNVATVRRGLQSWEVALSFPSHVNKPYVVGVSLSGSRPGFSVGGRRIALNPDQVTTTALSGSLAPLVTGMTGLLDATGRGTAWINMNSLPILTGLRINLVGLVLDPGAPAGIALISDPATIIV